jgi:drug/metabolite transporter (DMT)-like permease
MVQSAGSIAQGVTAEVPMAMSPTTLQGAGLGLLAFGLFASHDVVVKFLGASYSPFQILFFSVLFSFPLVTVMLMRDAAPGTLRPLYPRWTILRTVAATVTGLTAFYAFSVLPLAIAYAILFASPLLITVMAIPILGEKVGWRRGLAVCVGLGGVIYVLQPGEVALGLGHLAALTAAVCGAFASVVVRKIGREERSAVLLLYPMVANFALTGMALPFVYKPMPALHIGLLFVMAGLAFVATLCLFGAYRRSEAVIVAPMQYSQLIWATGFGVLIFGETPSRETLIGAAIIVASGLYIVFREGTGPSENTPVLRTRSRFETGNTPRVAPMIYAREAREEAEAEEEAALGEAARDAAESGPQTAGGPGQPPSPPESEAEGPGGPR